MSLASYCLIHEIRNLAVRLWLGSSVRETASLSSTFYNSTFKLTPRVRHRFSFSFSALRTAKNPWLSSASWHKSSFCLLLTICRSKRAAFGRWSDVSAAARAAPLSPSGPTIFLILIDVI